MYLIYTLARQGNFRMCNMCVTFNTALKIHTGPIAMSCSNNCFFFVKVKLKKCFFPKTCNWKQNNQVKQMIYNFGLLHADYIAYVPFSQLPVRSQILAAFNRCEDAVKRRKTFKLAITVVCGINESNHESESPILSERKRKIPRKLKIVITSKPTSLHPFRLSKFKANTSSCDVTVNICDDISVTDISDMDVTINMFFATKNASNQRRNAQDNNIGKILYKYTHTSLKILKK
uniref:uncharacterized protein LOC108950198 isoform X1 n=1 Tax=Ciona intestinalis TaxID=7719 RepID=UPI000EF4EC05|nr:uncharacterized protein LOC108950198 isoform X1 [Ciona intestinalis]|eukprot:XP_026693830.1 uncharacterized protein LOC108950198 isoform X1 [Ciona intestinalis]